MINTTFIFDGIKSSDMGIYNVRMSGGLVETPFISSRDIQEDSLPHKDINVFYGVSKKPLEFTLTFSPLEDGFGEQKKMEIARWLIQDEYKDFQTTDYLGKIFRVIATSEVKWITNGTEMGYFEIGFRCDAPYAWSPVYMERFDLSGNTTKTTIELWNKSNVNKYYYPELEFKLEGTSTGLTLKNLSDEGREFKFTGLNLKETVYVNNDRKRIISDIGGVYRLNEFNKNWLRLKQGRNIIEVAGACIIETRMQFPLYV